MPEFRHTFVTAWALAAGLSGTVDGYDVNDDLSIGLTVSAAVQQLLLYNDIEYDETGAAILAQPDVAWRPSASGEVYARLGFSEGNALNNSTPFHLAPWAADLEDNVTDINGRGRNYLLVARYRHTFDLSSAGVLSLSGGILDSTDYLDVNAYANDERTQFMNEIFVNSASYFLPSYDYGIGVEWTIGDWSLNGVLMWVGENDDGRPFVFTGLQGVREFRSSWGAGHFRVNFVGTDNEFVESGSSELTNRLAWGLSIDQEMGEYVGGFLRFGWQTEYTVVLYKALYSGGLEFKGTPWDRESDRLGVGLAWVEGANSKADRTVAFECYYRFNLNEWISLTGDVQYMNDDNRVGPSPSGWVLGVRTTAQF